MKVTSAEFIKNYGSLADCALSRPVTITKNGRDRLVVLSADAYERLKAGRTDKPRARPSVKLEDFSPGELSLIAVNQVPGGPDGAAGGLLFVFVGVAASSEPEAEPRSAVMLVFTRESEPPEIRIFPMAAESLDQAGEDFPQPMAAKPVRKRAAERRPPADAAA